MNYSDRPIHSKDEDQLGRSHFASMCARAIVNLRIEETFTIGLYGKWGNGKTSLINLMVNEIERLNASKQDVEPMHIVRFEPWVFSDSNQLMSQFFIHLANELRGKGSAVFSNIGEKLEKYAWLWQVSKMVPWEVMVPLLGQGAREMADAAQNVTENIGRTMHGDAMSADILTQKKAIVDLLEKQEDRILIVIDDIDRLNNDQIRQVFQLVTAVANFPNVTYLLSFDKEIVVNALADVQKGNGEEYLEKIVQMPISLPDVQREDIKKILYTRLRGIQRQYTVDLFDEKEWKLNYEYYFEPYVKNIRDINRLCNAVSFKYGALTLDVHFMDLVGITVLELFAPTAYEWVKNHREMLLGSYGDRYALMHGFDERDTKEELENYLGESESKEQIHAVNQLIERLFPNYKVKKNRNVYRHSYENNWVMSSHRIGIRANIDRYFHLDINRISLTEQQATYFMYKASKEELKTFFLRIEGTDADYYYFKILHEHQNQLTIDRIECNLRALIQASRDYKILKRRDASHHIAELLLISDKKEKVYTDLISNVAWEDIIVLALLLHWYNPKRERHDCFTDTTFVRLQTVFLNRMKELSWENQMFDADLGYIIFSVVNEADGAYASEAGIKLCEKDENAIKLVDWIVRQNLNAISDEVVWKVDNYYPFITADQICGAITRQKEINAIPPHLAEKCEFFLEHSSDYKEPPASDEEE